MAADEQTLKIQTIDHRGHGEPTTTVEVFSSHKKYLRRVRSLVDERASVREETWTRITLYPDRQALLFDEGGNQER
jgi:alpha-beta hydrolase superfamily lysophospholipase